MVVEDAASLRANIAPFGKMIVFDLYDPEVKYLIEKKSSVG